MELRDRIVYGFIEIEIILNLFSTILKSVI
jgi:hypothetical protein